MTKNLKPSPRQALAIFSMVFGRTKKDQQPDMKTLGLKPMERTQLVQQGLIDLEKASRGQRAVVTERGWAWAAENLRAKLDERSPAGKALAGVLARLDGFLRVRDTALSEFASVTVDRSAARRKHKKEAKRPKAAEPKSRQKAAGKKPAPSVVSKSISKKGTSRKAQPSSAKNRSRKPATTELYEAENTNAARDGVKSVVARIRSEALVIARGATRTRVRLRDLRARLTDLPREQVDRGLFALAEQGGLVLYRIDDANDLDDEDKRAAVMVAGNPRHVVYLEK